MNQQPSCAYAYCEEIQTNFVYFLIFCHDFNFGLTTKAKAWKVWAKNATQESHLHPWECEGMCEGMSSHTPK
jgi:hypothetical protein